MPSFNAQIMTNINIGSRLLVINGMNDITLKLYENETEFSVNIPLPIAAGTYRIKKT